MTSASSRTPPSECLTANSRYTPWIRAPRLRDDGDPALSVALAVALQPRAARADLPEPRPALLDPCHQVVALLRAVELLEEILEEGLRLVDDGRPVVLRGQQLDPHQRAVGVAHEIGGVAGAHLVGIALDLVALVRRRARAGPAEVVPKAGDEVVDIDLERGAALLRHAPIERRRRPAVHVHLHHVVAR